MSLRAKFILAAALVALVLVVGLQNRQPITLRFLFWSAVIDRFLLLFGTFVVGVGTGALLFWAGRRRSPKA